MEWPEAISEGPNLEEYRSMILDALREKILAYREERSEIPVDEKTTPTLQN